MSVSVMKSRLCGWKNASPPIVTPYNPIDYYKKVYMATTRCEICNTTLVDKPNFTYMWKRKRVLDHDHDKMRCLSCDIWFTNYDEHCPSCYGTNVTNVRYVCCMGCNNRLR